MSEFTRAFGTYMGEQLTSLAADTPLRPTLGVIAAALSSDDSAEMERYAGDLGQLRAGEGRELSEVMRAFGGLRGGLWEQLDAFMAARGSWDLADVRAIEGLLHTYRNAFLTGFSSTYKRIERELAQQAEQIESQRFTIRQLGSPILPLYEGVIALPLVGVLDEYRATQVLEQLLEAISAKQADIVIIDITGVAVVDTNVANYLLQAARAAQLIGAQVVLVGIGAEIAQTLVQLGVNLGQLKVYANLQAGINYALGELGYRITSRAAG
jgi:rsbT co-antagonist protein RsbR